MKNQLLSGLSSILLPLGLYGAPTQAASYQRSYLSASIGASPVTHTPLAAKQIVRDAVVSNAHSLDIMSATSIHELVVIDASVPDKQVLYRGVKPGIAIAEIDSSHDGLNQLTNILSQYKNLSAVHIISHASEGTLLLGNSRITAENIKDEVQTFAALHGAVREGGDLLFYGCDLAANEAGEELLDIISNKTGLDVAASNNLTGNHDLHGDWELEVKRGKIESSLAFSDKALKDFSSVLVASNGTKTFSGWSGIGTSQLSTTDFTLNGKTNGSTQILGIFGGIAYMPGGSGTSNHYFYVKADGTNTTAFELTALTSGEAPGYSAEFTNVHIVGYVQSGGTVSSSTINGSAGNQTFSFGGGQLSLFSGVKLKGFKLFFDCSSACNTALDSAAYFEFRNFTIQNAINTPPPPTVTHGNISISGASGTSGAYKIGDIVTATWNNTAGGDNNSGVTGVTVDFSQFGGGSAVTASNSSGTWTATYTITAGSIDLTSRNVSVTATNSGGNRTTADQTNATVDNIAPTLTDGRISISGASGTSGAYKIGDTVTATWNNTAGGDNNSDTISSTTVNFTQFGGGAAVSATNSSGTWTATYTIVAGSIDLTNRNVTVTATDNAGNTTATSDTTNATVDNIAPSVSSIAVSGSPASTDTSMAFTVTFNESVSNVSTDDFTLVGTGTASGSIGSVSASSGSSLNTNITGISGNGTLKVNLNGSTNIVDDVGNAIPTFTSGSTHTVAIPTAPGAPTIGTATAGDSQISVTFTAPGSNGGSAITTYVGTANPGGATGSCAGPAACTITITGLTNGTAYTATVTAANAVGTGSASGASNSVTPKGVQTITFANPGTQTFGTTPTLTATATSSLTPAFTSSTTGVCTITSGGALTFVTAGTCTINADQAGNSSWNAASQVSQSFTVNAVVPGAPTIGTATAGNTQAIVTFTAPASSGGASITSYTATANPGGASASGASSPITVTGLTNGVAYTFTITATNSAGTGSASAASNSVTPAAPQTITFANPGAQNFGTAPTLTATSTSSLTTTFTSSTTGVCTITTGGTLTFVTAGTCTINADQAGNSSFLAATQVSQSFTVNAVVPAAPTIGAATAGDTQASVTFTAPASSGGASITGYTVTSNPGGHTGTGASSPVTVTGLTNGIAYTFTVTATNSAGTGSASAASNSITPAASQTITFTNPGSQNFGTTPTLTATADSGLTPTFTSSTTGVCTITTGGALTFVTAGTCTINANQAGNSSYLAASQVSQSFTVNAVAPGAPTIGTATAGNAQASVTFVAPANIGGAAITVYTVTSNPGGLTGTGASSPITVAGLTNGTAYTFRVTATNSAGVGSASGASNSVTPKGVQTITFTNPGTQNFGTSPTLTATASSGLTPTFSSSTTGICTITSGGTLTFASSGTCIINADQAGNGTWNTASTVTHSFSVNPVVPDAPTIGTATAGNAQATVTFVAPGNSGGAAISGYTVTSNPGGITASGAGSPITVTGLTNGTAYTFTVAASNSAGAGSASGASNSVTPKGVQTITFAAPGAQSFGTSPTLTATTTSSLTLIFSSSTTSVCTITSAGALTFITPGTCTISVNQAGNTAWNAATPVTRSFAVNAVVPGAPTIGTATAGNAQATVTFVAPSSIGGAAITGYTVTSNPGGITASGTSSPITVTGLTNGTAYSFTVTATNSAGVGSASGASNSVTPKGSQTITFANPNAQSFDTNPTLTATASSSLAPTFSSSTASVCTITSDGTLTFITPGTCTISVDQAGNTAWNAATTVTHSFTVNTVAPGAPVIGTATAGNAQATVAFVAPATIGGAAITGYTVTSNPGGITASGTGSPITITGLTNGTAYTFRVTATNSAGVGSASGASNSVTPVSSQTITFADPGSKTLGDPLTLIATASSGLTPSFTSSTTGVCTVTSAGVVTLVTTGTCTISANQSGNNAYLAATPVSRSFTVNPIPNRAPTINGSPVVQVNQDIAYQFIPTASDADKDTLTFSITNKPSWASFNTTTGALTGTPVRKDVGVTSGIVISVSDGTLSTSLPAFAIEVVSTVDPLTPVLSLPADLHIRATALHTPVGLRQLIGLTAAATQADLDAALAKIASDNTSGNACCKALPAGLNNNSLLLAPGHHEIKWTATNAAGLSVEGTQIVDIDPIVSLSKSQVAVRGSSVNFRVILNGTAPVYPLTIPYSIDSATSATTAEYSLSSGPVTFTQGQLEVDIPVQLAAVTGLSDSQLVISLGNGINAGAANRHVINIHQGNIPPVVSLDIRQSGVSTSLIAPAAGPVTVTVGVQDANTGDTHTFDWSATSGLADTDGNPTNASRTFDPSGLTGSHELQVTVTDSAGASVQAQAYFRVVAALPLLSETADTDKDGISDALEGIGDDDSNGIPDYLDNMPSANILPQTGSVTNAYLLECDPGVRCGLGLFARNSTSGGVQILDAEVGKLDSLKVDPLFTPAGGVFDFAIKDLPVPGQNVRVVIPQQAPIPANAVYRKFHNGQWVNFVVNATNALHSTAGNPGYCPPPGSADWTPGLTQGHLCVQLTIEDGGANDDDGLVNSAVVDPGAVSVAVPVIPPVEPPNVEIKAKRGGAISEGWLLLLGGLMLVRRIKPKWFALIALVLASASANADIVTYLRLDAFQAKGDQTEGKFTDALGSHIFTLNTYDSSRTGFQAAFGYEWNKFTYTELGYLDLGDANVNLTLSGKEDLTAFGTDFSNHYPRTGAGITLVQGISFALSPAWTLSAEAGLFAWQDSAKLNITEITFNNENAVDFLFGARVDYRLNKAWRIGLNARRVTLDDQHVDLLGVSTAWQF